MGILSQKKNSIASGSKYELWHSGDKEESNNTLHTSRYKMYRAIQTKNYQHTCIPKRYYPPSGALKQEKETFNRGSRVFHFVGRS